MHFLYFVLLSQNSAVTSEAAMNLAESSLDQEGFTGSWYFWYWRADRFGVWGRWSWVLNEDYLLTPETYADRDGYSYKDDDAQILTMEKITYLQQLYDGMVEIFDAENLDEFFCKDLSDKNVWMRLVVINYHY